MADEDEPSPFNNQELIEKLTKRNIQFAIDLYKMCICQDKNIIVAPFSLSAVLAMTMMGAREETATQIKTVLRLDDLENDEEIHLAYQDLIISLAGMDRQTLSLFTANRVYVDDGFELSEDFKASLEQHYQTTAGNVNFAQDSDEARGEINSWVAENTGDNVRETMIDGSVDMFTAMILINVAYFRGEWSSSFDVGETHYCPVYAGCGKKMVAEMMHQEGMSVRYGENEDLQCRALEIPYVGGRLRLLILLPTETDGIRTLESQLDADVLGTMIENLSESTMNVALPKFSIHCNLSLSDILSQMGMPGLFSEEANLSGITDAEGLHVSAVIQKALVEVNETGGDQEPHEPEMCSVKSDWAQDDASTFVVDRPFMFFIRDKASEIILFMGSLQSPTLDQP